MLRPCSSTTTGSRSPGTRPTGSATRYARSSDPDSQHVLRRPPALDAEHAEDGVVRGLRLLPGPAARHHHGHRERGRDHGGQQRPQRARAQPAGEGFNAALRG